MRHDGRPVALTRKAYCVDNAQASFQNVWITRDPLLRKESRSDSEAGRVAGKQARGLSSHVLAPAARRAGCRAYGSLDLGDIQAQKLARRECRPHWPQDADVIPASKRRSATVRA